ncbi:hypothetical protein FA95DRAFT_1505427 [Auriscalpium vulgare]|uniref:Uncharacterized protein n=1 Tax=Auriscalpium vulgare TaxID=40419 RepID=A0ACB8R3A2_9AGAM|nr:hypothetical protein FA95DRAFT_1505427 [Auriscalpium vulgare]
MLATLLSATFLSLLAVVRADFAVNSPVFTQCAPVELSWGETTGPYNVLVVNQDDPCSDALVDLGDHNSTKMTWNAVSLPAGKSILVSVEDATGDEAWTQNITVKASNDVSCLSAKDRASLSSSAIPSSTASSTVLYVHLVVPSETPSTSDGSVAPVGAANAGANPLGDSKGNGAFSVHRLYTPAIALGALGAALALAL